jgi:PIN domain nuclease of toxin-antitoxin system
VEFGEVNVLLDTATWINAVKEPETLPAKALRVLQDSGNAFFLADISLLEASMLSRKGRLDLGMPLAQWLEKALAATLQVLPISERVVAAEYDLPLQFHGDPADRIIAGTAIAHDLTLVTPDARIEFHRVCRTIRYKWPTSRKTRRRAD